MKIFNSLILSVSLLNFSASAMEVTDKEVTDKDTNVSRRLSRPDADTVNEKVAAANSHRDFINKMYKDHGDEPQINSGGNFHVKDWQRFQNAIKADPLYLNTNYKCLAFQSWDSGEGFIEIIFNQPRIKEGDL